MKNPPDASVPFISHILSDVFTGSVGCPMIKIAANLSPLSETHAMSTELILQYLPLWTEQYILRT